MKRLIVCNKRRRGIEVVFDKAFDETLTVEQLSNYMELWSKNVTVCSYEDEQEEQADVEAKEEVSEVEV